jgi:hypothetical protein
MPLYLIDGQTLDGYGPHTSKSEVAESAESVNGSAYVLDIDENGNIVKVYDALDYLDDPDTDD